MRITNCEPIKSVRILEDCRGRTKHSMLSILTGVILLSAIEVGYSTTTLPINLSDLVALSESIIVGKVVKSHCEWSPDKKTIITLYTISINESRLRGLPEGETTIATLGGSIDGRRMIPIGVPELRVGDEVLLFIGGNIHGRKTIMGWQAGVFRLFGSHGKSQISVFNYDWNGVAGIQGNDIVLAYREEGTPTDVSSRHEVAQGCVNLAELLQVIDRILGEHQKAGYHGPFHRSAKVR